MELRKLIFILFLFTSVLQAQTVWYIDPTGSDITGTGTEANPWATLHKACDEVTTSGDIIHVNTGSYNETIQSVLSVGVSIEGEGINASIINSTVSDTDGTILLYSTEGTNGNQHISDIALIGGLTAHSAIWVMGRSNVHIYNCRVITFFSRGVTFAGSVTDVEPTTYATGNRFYNNYVYNNADYYLSGKVTGDGKGNLVMGGQDGFLVYDNHIEQPLRAGTDNTGYPIKFEFGGFYKNMKIYNNTIKRCAYDGTWDFAMELWHSRGGIEIYNNIIEGGIDIGGGSWGGSICANDEAGAGYALKIYNNTIGFSSLQSVQQIGIYLERGITGGVYIYGNTIRNHWNAFQFYQGDGDTFEDVYVYSNIISGIGQVGASGANTTEWGTIDVSNITYDNINFINNSIYAGSTATIGNSGLRFTFKGTASNVRIRNNIIRGFNVYPIYIEGGTINTISIENNNYYDNDVANDAIFYGATVTGLTEQNNITTDPLWVSLTDFHLQATSPCEGTGIYNSTVSYDYAGTSFLNPPSIGAYERTSGASIPTLTTTAISSITNTTASSGGVISSDGGASVTARGVCWSTSTGPTTADDKTTDGTGTGSFVSSLTGLDAGTDYYVRAYATNSIGTAYGNERVFQTDPDGGVKTIGLFKHNGLWVKHLGKHTYK